MRARLARRTVALREPLVAAHGTVRERELLLLTLTDDDGLSGRGEAAPLPAYDGSDVEAVWRTLQAYVPALEAAGAAAGATLLEVCRAVADEPIALAAVDLALWDLAGRREGRPVCELLCDSPLPAVPVNATIGAQDRAGAATAAADAVAAGYGCVKVKVGVGDDAGRVAAVRAAIGPQPLLRLDANGAWSVEEAERALAVLAPAGLELVEEPVHGIDAMRALRARTPVRLAIDETAGRPGALGAGVADAVCLKISRCGGIGGLLAAAALVRAGGAEPYVASTLDGPLGIAAALHAAAALGSRPGELPPCGLATLPMLEGLGDVLPIADGAMTLPGTAGLGVGSV